MSDVSVSLGVTGKDTVLGAFSQVGSAGKQMGETFGSIATKLAGLAAGYLSISKVMDSFNAVLNKGGQLADFSDQTGIAVDKLVVLGRAFENNGMKAEDLGSIVNKMQKQIAAAGVEGSEAADKINKLGLKVSDLQGLDPDKQFELIAKAIAGIQDPTERSAAAMEIFGKSGGRVLAFINDFDGNISQAKSEVGSFADEMARKAKTFDAIGDGLRAIGDKLMEFTAGILDEAAPALEMLVSYFKGVDATSFGKSFSESLMRGLAVALSIFRDPGNLFIAFGDALTVALKGAGNALINGFMYAFEWVNNYAAQIIPNYSTLLSNSFTVAFGFVASFFSGKLADVIGDLAALLPDRFSGPLLQASAKLKTASDEWSSEASTKMAGAWDQIYNAAAKATEQTQLQSEDYLDAASSAADLSLRLDDAAQSGNSILDDMKQAVENARLITDEANAWEKASTKLADNLTGATDSFRSFADGETETAGLSAASGLITLGGAGPVATAADLRVKSSSNATARAATAMGRAPSASDLWNQYLRPSDYLGSSLDSKRSYGALEATLQSRIANQTAADFSAYASSNQFGSGAYNAGDISNRDTVVGNIAAALSRDTGVSFSDAKAQAASMYDEQFNKNSGPSGASVGSRGGGGPGAAAKESSDPISGIKEIVEKILDYMRESLPQHALT